jgi:hypothetical protein
MGKIEDEVFLDRVILEKDFQTRLFELYARFCGGQQTAAVRLGLKMTTYSAYKRYQSKSVPTKIFDAIFEDTKYTWLQAVLEFDSKEEKIEDRKTLVEIQAAPLKHLWTVDRERALDIARDASIQGLSTLQDQLGPDWKKKMNETARDALKNKYGEGAFRIIGEKGIIEAKRKYGNNLNKVISEGMIKALKRKYEEDYKQVLGDQFKKRMEDALGPDWSNVVSRMGHEALRKKFGNNFLEVTLMRARRALTAKYGDDYMRKIASGEREETVERRNAVLQLVISGEATTVKEIVSSTDLNSNTVKRALAKLMRNEEIVRERNGHEFVYRPARMPAS